MKHTFLCVCQGKGYPDVASLQLLWSLATKEKTKHLPIFALVDCDPHGLDILSGCISLGVKVWIFRLDSQ